jgi:hypothetical protein
MPPTHEFERSGLGTAPFKFVRVVRHPDVSGRCDYCGQSLRYDCIIRSADGREFTVGRKCVRKAGDLGLAGDVEAEFARLEQEERAARIALSDELRKRPEVAAALAARPHPFPAFAKDGKTLADWAEFASSHGGERKQLEVANLVIATAVRIGATPGTTEDEPDEPSG